MQIKLYRCFHTDQRISMQIYADQLEHELNSAKYEVSSYQPATKLEKYSPNSLLMRYLRYRQYPHRVKKADIHADVHHVVDHGYAHLLPKLGRGRSIVTVHDLIPLLAYRGRIETSNRGHRPRLNEYSLSFVKGFDCVVTPSQNTANDLQRYLDIPADKITVVAPMIGEVFAPKPANIVADFAHRHNLQDADYWVLMSGQEFYKNHETSLQVIHRLRGRGMNVQVLKTGVSTALFHAQVAKFELQNCVHQVFLKDVSDVAAAYAFVDCLLFPSYYEGFGMPVAEALACGTRVVTSNRGALSEIVANMSTVPSIAPDAVDSMTDALATQLELAKTESSSFQERAKQQVAKYRPNAIVPRWHQLYQNLVN